MARTQMVNNNTYCQDSTLSWINWNNMDKHADLYRYVCILNKFRKTTPSLDQAIPQKLDRSHSFHGYQPWVCDYSPESNYLGLMIDHETDGASTNSDPIYVGFNNHWEGANVVLPEPHGIKKWHVFANTGMAFPNDIFDQGSELELNDQSTFFVGPRSSFILIAK